MDNNEIIPIENEEEEILTFEEMYPDEELDEETLNLIYNTNVVEIDFTDDNKKEKNQKKIKKEKEIEISLDELIEKNKKPAWVSERTKDKKTDKSLLVKTPRFKFNPKLPPYNMVQKNFNEDDTNIKLDDKNLFPHLL